MENSNKRLEKNVLINPLEEPKDNVLENTLSEKYKLYVGFMGKINKMDLFPEWKYYNDTKSWLCRIIRKKKNLKKVILSDIEEILTIRLNEPED